MPNRVLRRGKKNRIYMLKSFYKFYATEYENIYTDDLARQRAEYELWLHTNMSNTISMTCVPMNFLDVNMKFEHAFKGKETHQYITKSISMDLNPLGTQTIQAIRFYPLYPFIINNSI